MQNGGCSGDQTCHSVRTQEPCNPLLQSCFNTSCHKTKSKLSLGIIILPNCIELSADTLVLQTCENSNIDKAIHIVRHTIVIYSTYVHYQRVGRLSM